MIEARLGVALVLLLALPHAGAIAQTLQPRPISRAVKHAGTYHLATGTWSGPQSHPGLAGPAQLYDNTCTVGYYLELPPNVGSVSSGRIPSLDDGGLANCYEINCFQFAYCSYEPNKTSIDVRFWESLAACDSQDNSTLVRAFTLLNFPGGTPQGSQGCWMVNVDLTDTTYTFGLGGNVDGVWDNVPSVDHFGWTWTQTTPPVGSNGGPLIAGDPLAQFNSSCGVVNPSGPGGSTWTGVTPSGQGAGTDHPGWGFSAGPGTGIGSDLDQVAYDGISSCYWFGGYGAAQNPMAALYLKLWGQPGDNCISVPPDCSPSTRFCFGDAFSCPGGVPAVFPDRGCPHFAGPGGNEGTGLYGLGNASFFNDTFSLFLENGPSSAGLVIQGDSAIQFPFGNSNLPDSAGILCVAPQQRGFVIQPGGGSGPFITDFRSLPFGASAQPVGAATFYQFWFRDPSNPNANPGSGASFNFSNAVSVDWCP